MKMTNQVAELVRVGIEKKMIRLDTRKENETIELGEELIRIFQQMNYKVKLFTNKIGWYQIELKK